MEVSVMDITQDQQKKEKRILKYEDGLRDQRLSIEHNNIHIIGTTGSSEQHPQFRYLKLQGGQETLEEDMGSPLNQSLTHGWGETHTIPRPSTRVTSPLQILHCFVCAVGRQLQL